MSRILIPSQPPVENVGSLKSELLRQQKINLLLMQKLEAVKREAQACSAERILEIIEQGESE